MLDKLLTTIQSGGALLTRDQIEPQYKWDLTHIYNDEAIWEKDFKWVEESLPNYKKFEGQLENKLLECIKFSEEVEIKLERLYLYAFLSKDSDTKVTKYLAMEERVKSMYSRLMAASSFINPEILEIPEDKLNEIINSSNEMKVYKHKLEELLRNKAHTLSKREEEILSMAVDITTIPYSTFSILNNAEMQFPKILNEEGNEIEVSHGRYGKALYSKDRSYRERMYKSYYKPYKEYVNTLTTLFNGNLKTKIFNAKVRHYNSTREAALFHNNIPVEVYDNLIDSVNQNLAPLHRWASLKKKILKLDELHPYDVYVSLFSPKEKKYTYDEARSLVLDALKPMGEEYIKSLNLAFNNRWIDVYETQHKRSGAYSSGSTFGIHPYVLLNWNDLLNDVFTLAHEMGHNMHSYYTGLNQPYPYANYTIFLAEVTSTFNESMLLNYLIERADKDEKLYLLERYINDITATFYRQTMFAEFERDVYERTERGEALTSDTLRKLFRDIYQKYWGPEMVLDEEEEFTWARVPHFYYNFYVYQYATGLAASEVLSHNVIKDGQKAVDKYLNFLKSGSSQYSLSILKNAGVDMNSPQPILETTRTMNSLLDEVEKLIS